MEVPINFLYQKQFKDAYSDEWDKERKNKKMQNRERKGKCCKKAMINIKKMGFTTKGPIRTIKTKQFNCCVQYFFVATYPSFFASSGTYWHQLYT